MKLRRGRTYQIICSFQNRYGFLSNFYLCPIIYNSEVYKSVEHAYQASKTLNKEERSDIRAAITPGYAKRLGKQIVLRKDWEEKKLNIMRRLVRQKFTMQWQGYRLKRALLVTKSAILIEGNNWHDRYWGMCDGEGENHLGRLLMEIRSEIR